MNANASNAGTISVIIVSWNAVDYLRACLQSVYASGGKRIAEVIVVDNNSSDGSPEMVQASFSQATLHRAGANLGFAKANNLALKLAKSDYVALVNSDALVRPGCLETLSGWLDEHPDCALVGPRVLGGDGLLQRTSRRLPGLWNTLCRALALDRVAPQSELFGGYEVPDCRHEHLHRAEVLSGCFCVVRRSAVQAVGGMDERFFFYGEDIDWSKRFSDAGWTLYFVPQAEAVHFGGGSSSNAPLRYSIEILRATLAYWRKHHGRLGRAACRALLLLHHGLRLPLRYARHLLHPADDARRHKLREDAASLRWLAFGTELSEPRPPAAAANAHTSQAGTVSPEA